MNVPAELLRERREILAVATLDTRLAHDQYISQREQGGRLCDRALFAHLSDLELACVYRSGEAQLHDTAYCELHLRSLTPWKIFSCPPLELAR